MTSPASAAPGEFAPWFGLFETVRVVDGVPLFESAHRANLYLAMSVLDLAAPVDLPPHRAALPRASGRWRWIVRPGQFETHFTPEAPASPGPIPLSVSPLRLGSRNWDARFKTLSYLTHAQALKIAPTPEVVLLNEHGHVAGAATGNLFWRRGDRLFTPAHEAGCRTGVVRAFVQKHRPVEEGHFPWEHLREADEIFLTNSMKGLVSINALTTPQRELRWTSFPLADDLRALYARAVDDEVARHT